MLSLRTSPTAVAIGFIGSLAAGPAHAWCRTSTASTPTFDGHVCTPAVEDDEGIPIYWGMPRVTYSLQKDDVHVSQAMSHLKATGHELALLINFDVPVLAHAGCEAGRPEPSSGRR